MSARRVALAVAGTAALVLAVLWRLWTPIDGARRLLPGGLASVALLVALGVGVLGWLRARGASAAAAALAAGVAIVSLPASAAAVPWALLAAEAWADAPGWPRAALVGAALALVQLAGGDLVSAGLLVAAVAAARARGGWLTLALPVALVAAAVLATRAPAWPAHALAPAAAWAGAFLTRWRGAILYLGVVPLVAGGAAVALRPGPRTAALAVLAVAGVATGNAVLALLPTLALAAEGLDALGPAQARLLGGLAIAALVAIGVGVTVTSAGRGGKATSPHDALVLSFFAWCASLWALWQLASTDTGSLGPYRPVFPPAQNASGPDGATAPLTSGEGARRRLLLVLVAAIGVADVWFSRTPAIEAQLTQPKPR